MLTVMGGLLTSIGHEIMSRLSILRSANRVQTAWHSLKQNPLLLQDSDFVARMEGNLKRLVAAKDGLQGCEQLAGLCEANQSGDGGCALLSRRSHPGYRKGI
jgi:hypothetical protein